MNKSSVITVLMLVSILIAVMLLNMDQGQPVKADAVGELDQGGCLALNYHRVAESKISTKILESLTQSDELRKYSIYEEEFEHQIKTLVDNDVYFATVVDVLRFQEENEFPDNCIWISFDDVDETVYNQAFPILDRYDIPFTLFLIASQVGNEDFSNLKMSTWDQIQEMVDSGLANIGSHTYDMHFLENDEPVFHNQGNYDKFGEDLLKSKNTIETNLHGVEVVDFSYPFGDGREKLAQIIRDNGFRTASILAPHTIDAGNDPYWLNRLLVDTDTFEQVVLPWLK